LDVYEQILPQGKSGRIRTVMWFNPATGMPLKSQQYLKSHSVPEFLQTEYEQIIVDRPPRKDMFTFEPPKGCQIVRRDRGRDAAQMAGIAWPERRVILRFIFNISDQAILLCWADRDRTGTDVIEPGLGEPYGLDVDVRPGSWSKPWPHRRHLLRIDPGKERDWRWLLMVPDEENAVVEHEAYAFTFKFEKPHSAIVIAPLRFDRQKLVRWLADAQALTLPKDAPPGSAFTLEQLEDLINQEPAEK
jgi:hypothetical protein